MSASVEIESRELGKWRWYVMIRRSTGLVRQTLWDRYQTYEEAVAGEKAARAYLADPVANPAPDPKE